MKRYHKNPRQITSKQVDLLADTLDELGDLSGVVHDLNSDEIIGGNMRGDVFNVNMCEIELTHKGDEPDEQGTVAHGYIVWKGKRYAYRQVRWTPRQCEKANIVANKGGGGWDFDILSDQFDFSDLTSWGFESFELGVVPNDEDWGDAMGGLPTEDKAPFQQMTFTLHDSQAEEVKRAIGIAAKLGDFTDSPNQNGNGNALAFICETFVTEHGNS